MNLTLTDGRTVACTLQPEELYSLYTAHKKGARVFILIEPRSDGERHGKVFLNIECVDCHKTLGDIMVVDRDTPASPLEPSF